MDRARGHGVLFLAYHIYTLGHFFKLTEGFDQTKNSWVACALTKPLPPLILPKERGNRK
jgi:hypothetical protein